MSQTLQQCVKLKMYISCHVFRMRCHLVHADDGLTAWESQFHCWRCWMMLGAKDTVRESLWCRFLQNRHRVWQINTMGRLSKKDENRLTRDPVQNARLAAAHGLGMFGVWARAFHRLVCKFRAFGKPLASMAKLLVLCSTICSVTWPGMPFLWW